MRQWVVWLAVAVCGSSCAGAQSEAALWQYFEGRTVIAKVDLPATKVGLDIYPDSAPAVNSAHYGKTLKEFGISARRNQAITITDVRVKPKSIEIELGGVSAGETSPSIYVVAVKSQWEKNLESDLEHETDPARKERMARELDALRQRREREDVRLKAALEQLTRANPALDRRPQDSGSRFNLIFPGGVPSRALAPEYIVTALKPWIDFDQGHLSPSVSEQHAVRAPEPASEPSPSLPGQTAHTTDLRKGLTEAELQHLLGDPVKRESSVEGDLHVEILTFKKNETTVEATIVEGVLVRFREWSN